MEKILACVQCLHSNTALVKLILFLTSAHLFPNPEGRWGTTGDFPNQLPPSFSVLHCLLELGELQACPFRDVVFPRLLQSALSSSPFHCALQHGFARPDERETCPYHCSLRLFTMARRSSCGPIACWILARTSSLVTWSLYEMCSILR